MKTPRFSIDLRNSSIFRLQIVHFISKAAVVAYCERQILWNHPDLQHGDWIERIILNSPISSWQMAHNSVFLWRTVSFTLWCLLQNDLYLSKNSKRQSCLVAHGRWKLLRHFLSQQLMLAPFLWQKMHFYGFLFSFSFSLRFKMWKKYRIIYDKHWNKYNELNPNKMLIYAKCYLFWCSILFLEYVGW